MLEKIYTIPVNESFDACAENYEAGCPFCRIRNTLENNELELILGASMMEPDVRLKTNELGFCPEHYGMMLHRKNRLGMALTLESHLDVIRGEIDRGGLTALIKGAGSGAPERIQKLEGSCYICGRIEYSFDKMIRNAALLWESEPEFRAKTKSQPYFCLPHYRQWLQAAKIELSKKKYPDFYDDVSGVVLRYFDELRGDVSWFCKKFDYRYENEPWGNSKDAVERAILFLGSDMHQIKPQ